MSHINNIDGYSSAAAEMREHWERMRAIRQARRDGKTVTESLERTFDSAIDPDGDREGEESSPDRDSGGEHPGRYA